MPVDDTRFETAQIPGSYARALLHSVAERGHDPKAFAESEGVTEHYLAECEALSAALFGRLYQRAMILLQDESLGMASGGRMVVGTFRMMCLCVIHRPTLRLVVERAGEFLDVCNGMAIKPCIFAGSASECIGFATVLHERQRSVQQILAEDGPMRVRTSLFMWKNLLNWFAGRSLPLLRVEFAFPEPARGALWRQLFRAPVLFDCEHSSLRYDMDALDQPNVQSEQTLSVFLQSAPYRLIVPSYREARLSERVLALLGEDMRQAPPSAEHISRQLGMSVSTLRRQLLEEGTSYQRLKDERRMAAAMRYLATRELSHAQISQLLGFTEVSAFFRAFKRWTGDTPSAYRASL